MNSEEYIQNAIRTESVPTTIDMNQVALASLLRIGLTAGKLVDLAKRKVFYGKDIPQEEMLGMLGILIKDAGLLGHAIKNASTSVNQRMDDITDDQFNVDRLNIRLLHAGMGCFTESGELLEALYKCVMTGEMDIVNFGEEIGDIEWYQAVGFHESGVSEASCREKNIAKLRKRYPEKFDAVQAVNRDLVAERAALEDDIPGADR